MSMKIFLVTTTSYIKDSRCTQFFAAISENCQLVKEELQIEEDGVLRDAIRYNFLFETSNNVHLLIGFFNRIFNMTYLHIDFLKDGNELKLNGVEDLTEYIKK